MRREMPQLMVTEQDFDRLSAITLSQNNEVMNSLAEELARAEVVPQKELPSDVVTMNSVVKYREEETNEVREVGLVYPVHADAKENRISVLAPVGLALLGLRVGQTIEWIVPSGKKRLTVLEVSFQPEAYGKYDF